MNKGTTLRKGEEEERESVLPGGLDQLLSCVARLWSQQTSVDPANWSPGNPAWGQCAVTSLIIQDCFGGDLVRSTVGGISHYWNVLPDGSVIDVTFEQFLPGSRLDSEPEIRSREYVLSFPDTVKRYTLLRNELFRALQDSEEEEGGK